MAERGASGGGSGGDSLDKSITLPPDEIFRNLENAKRFAIDIGGSLTKLAYYSTVQHKVAKVRSFDHPGKVSPSWWVGKYIIGAGQGGCFLPALDFILSFLFVVLCCLHILTLWSWS